MTEPTPDHIPLPEAPEPPEVIEKRRLMEPFESMTLSELNNLWMFESLEFAPPNLRVKIRQIERLWQAAGRSFEHLPDFHPETYELPEPIQFATDPETGEPLSAYPVVRPRFFKPDDKLPINLSHDDPNRRWILLHRPFKQVAAAQHRTTVERYPELVDCFNCFEVARETVISINTPHHDHAARQGLEARLIRLAGSITDRPGEIQPELAQVALEATVLRNAGDHPGHH